MNLENKRPNISSFELNKLITTSRMLSKLKISPASKLVLRCIVDFWNPKLGYCFPKQKTIAECTGISKVSVSNIISELEKAELLTVKKKNHRLNYYFTDKFYSLLQIEVKDTLTSNYKNFNLEVKNPLTLYKKNNKSIENNIYPNIQKTKELLDSYTNLKTASPYDDYECAMDWLSSLNKTLLKQASIRTRVEKVLEIWDLDQALLEKILGE